MLDWIPPSWLMHHGQALDIRADRLISVTPDESREGLLEIQVVLAWCKENACRKDHVFTRNRYPGGWGPAHRVQDNSRKATYRQRCKLARESDIVEASQAHFPFLQVKRIVGA